MLVDSVSCFVCLKKISAFMGIWDIGIAISLKNPLLVRL